MKLKTGALLALLALLAGGCPAPEYAGTTVSGTIDLAAVGSPGTCSVELLNDAYAAVAATAGAYAGGGSYAYVLSNVLEGRYYLHVWLDFDVADGVADGERYYGNGVLPTPPPAPNVDVPFSGTVSCDLAF
jgi:hypothetical protein